MTEEKDILRANRDELVRALREAGAVFKGTGIVCPFHDDHSPSGSIYQGEDGAWRFRCHGCGVCEDVIGVRAKAAGKSPGDVLREMKPDRTPEKPARTFPTIADLVRSVGAYASVEARYVYAHPDTKAPEMIVVRCRDASGKKSFLQAKPTAGGFVMRAPPHPHPIYNRARVRSADVVFVVEGEKCVHVLHDLGLVATTSPGGAGKAHLADWSPLAGKTVYLWPDADEPDPKTGRVNGIDHMRAVAKELEALSPPAVVWWIPGDQLGLPPKGDVVEYLQAFGGADPKQAVLNLVELAEPLGAAAGLHRMLEETIAGVRRAIPWPWPATSRLSKALFPGTVTIVSGDPGGTKSFLMLEAGAWWHKQGDAVALYELEDDRAYHLNRVLAQQEGESRLIDDDWVRQHPEDTRAAFIRHREFLEGFGRRISDAPDDQVTLKDLGDWVRRQCAAGMKLIIIDPITAASTSDKPWIDDLKFLMEAKAAVRQSGARLILVTHPRKGSKAKGGGGLDELAGGAAYQRFAHTVLWVVKHDRNKNVIVLDKHGYRTAASVNRSIQIRKARNGRGGGSEIGFMFDGKSLCFLELGVIAKDAGDELAE